MKGFLTLLFAISIVVCTLCYLHSRKQGYRLRVAVSNLIGASGLTTAAYMVSFLTNNEQVMKISHCLYFAITDWLCLALLMFTLLFVGRTKYWKIACRFVLPLILLDSLSQVLNICYGHAIDLIPQKVGEDVFLVLQGHWPFTLHLALCYVMVGVSFGLLIWRIVKSASIYRVEYFTIFAILVLLVASNALFLAHGMEVDLSVLGYSVAAWLIYYYTKYYMPRQLTLRMSGILLDNMETTIILFDMYGRWVYLNKERKSIHIGKEMNRMHVCRQLGLEDIPDGQELEKEIVIRENGEQRILNVQYRMLHEKASKRQRIIGSYFLIEDVTEKRRKLLEREYKATHDDVTGLYSRGYFCERAQAILDSEQAEEYAVLMTDTYQFKIYNEIYGKEMGDQMLIHMAQLLKKGMTGRNFLYGRYEADRFVIFLPWEYCREELLLKRHVMDRIKSEHFQVVNYIGVCKVTGKGEDISVLCERAAIALNTIKGDASRRVAYFDAAMRDTVLREQELTAAFPEALKNGEIVFYIQPQINQKTHALVGGEVLARWITGDGTVISPGEFIPVLEKSGQVNKLDMHIWEKACQLAAEFYHDGTPIPLSVNISGQDFFRCDVYEIFKGLLKKYELPPEYLKLEITESEMITDTEKKIVLIEQLQDYGFTVEMDDFGSGYSSLNTLKDIPVDVLKMDMRFLTKSAYAERSRCIIRNVIRMAADLEIPVIAEGVESQEQASLLAGMDCNYIQGFLYGRPMPAENFRKLRGERVYEKMK